MLAPIPDINISPETLQGVENLVMKLGVGLVVFVGVCWVLIALLGALKARWSK